MSDVEPAPDHAAIRDFLVLVQPDGAWVLTAIWPEKSEGRSTRTRTFSDSAAASGWAQAQNGTGWNIYWTVNRPRGAPEKKPKKEDIEEALFTHVDVDPTAGADVAAERERILAALCAHCPTPTIIVDSGGGYQGLWRLREPFFVGGMADRWNDLEAYNRQLSADLGGDHCHNIERILRVAGTVNWPDKKKLDKGRVARRAELAGGSRQAYSLSAFRRAFLDQKPAVSRSTPTRVGRGSMNRLTNIDELTAWDIGERDRLRMLIVQGCDPNKTDGDRSRVVFDLCCNLHRRGVPAELIAGIISDPKWPISAHVLDKGKPDQAGYAWRQVEQAVVRVAAGGETKPRIVWSEVELPRCLDDAESALIQSALAVYQMADRLVQVVKEPRVSNDEDAVRRAAGSLVIVSLPKHRLDEHFLMTARFVKVSRDKNGNSKDTPFAPPLRFAETYMARRGAWRLPVLTGIATTPTMRADGSVVADDGYDITSGLIIDTQGIAFPRVAEAPSKDEGRAALDTLINVISEFPFVSDDEGGAPGGDQPSQSRAVALAMIITAVARPMFGAAPIFGISAPTMATGKSLLADVPAMIVTGRRATKMSQGASEEEDEKRLLSVLMQGDPVNVIDNIARPIEGDALCTILTEETWRCRLLGRSEMRDVGTRALFIATGNNLSFRNDMASRAVLANLDAEIENPGERLFGRDLKTYVPQHRSELAVAALTVLRAYIVAGRPKIVGMVASRFEDWAIVRAALMWLGEPDPWATNARVAVGDEARAEHHDLMLAVGAAFGFGEFLATTEIIERAQSTDATAESLHLALAAALPHGISAPGLGRFLKKFSDRRVSGIWIKAKPNEKKGGRYAIMSKGITASQERSAGSSQSEMSLHGEPARHQAQAEEDGPY